MMTNRIETALINGYEYFYIVDSKTYEILYGSEIIKELFGKECKGERCFQFFHQQSQPCLQCKEYLEAGAGEYYLASLDRYFWVSHNLIVWDKREAYLYTAVDITSKVKEQQRLEKTLEIERKHKELLNQFIASGNLEDALGKNLMVIGEYTKALRCRVLQLDEALQRVRVVYEWKKETNEVTKIEFPYDERDFVKRLVQTPKVVIHHVEQLDQDSKEYQLLNALGVHKMTAVPIWRFGKIYGYLAIYKDKQGMQEQPEELRLLQMFVSSLENIAEQEQVKGQERQLKEYERIRQELFSNISHEFKTPLNLINTTIQVLHQMKENKPEQFIEFYNRYENELQLNSYRMLRLLDNMLDLTKINTGHFMAESKKINLVQVIEDGVDHVREFLNAKIPVKLLFDTDEEELYLLGDAKLIQRVLLNLLANGVKFAARSEEIVVRISSDERCIHWVVENKGDCIPESYQPIIFEEFIQVEKTTTRQNEGCGMGLAISRALIELQGGTIMLDQQYTDGCRFRIKLPRTRLEEDEWDQYQLDQQGLVEKIQIEFSDIYDIQ